MTVPQIHVRRARLHALAQHPLTVNATRARINAALGQATPVRASAVRAA